MSFSDDYFKLVEEEKKKKKKNKTSPTSFEEKYWGLVGSRSTPSTRNEEPYSPSFSTNKKSDFSNIGQSIGEAFSKAVDATNKKNAIVKGATNALEEMTLFFSKKNEEEKKTTQENTTTRYNTTDIFSRNANNNSSAISKEILKEKFTRQQQYEALKRNSTSGQRYPDGFFADDANGNQTNEEMWRTAQIHREIANNSPLADMMKPVANTIGKDLNDAAEFVYEKAMKPAGKWIGSAIETILDTNPIELLAGVVDKASAYVGNATTKVAKGVYSSAEGVTDLGIYGLAALADGVGLDSASKVMKEKAQYDATEAVYGDVERYWDEKADMPQIVDAIFEGAGGLGFDFLTAGVGKAAKLGKFGQFLVTNAMQFAKGMGSSMSEAYAGGATDGEAVKHGLNIGAVEVGTNAMFGNMGKTFNMLGWSKGAIPIDEWLAKAATKRMINQTAKNLTEWGIKTAAGGVEEWVAGYLGAVSKSNTYLSEVDFEKIVEDENLLEQFIVGAALSGAVMSGYVPGTESGSLKEANKTGRDFITGYTQNEQTVIDKVVENKVAEQEAANGKKLNKKEIGKIEEQVKADMEKGDISTDTIEEILGGETYENFKRVREQEQADLAELSEMYEGDELQQQIENYVANSKLGEMQNNLSREVYETVKNGYLGESYVQRAKRKSAFTADLTKYEEKYRPTIQKAIDSGILNDTRKTHDFVDLIAKISADKGVNFDFVNNEKLRNSSFAVEGKIVNGYVDGDTIGLNLESNKALEKTVGHEITHILEGTELYDTFQNAAFEYAKSKKASDSRFANEYLERLYNTQQLYKDIQGYQGAEGFAKIKKEVAADLVGDYIFTDEQFVRNLSTNHKNIFKKIYDEIKYMYKAATAGSEQARQLEKVKKLFDEVYSESISAKATDGEVKHSISEEAKKTDSVYSKAVESGNTEVAQKILDETAKKAGYDIKAYHGTGYDFTVFDKSRQGDNYEDWGRLGKGFYFAPTSREAETWAELSKGGKNKVMPVYLRSENMLDSFEALPNNLKDTIPENWDSLTKRLAEKYAYNYIEYMQEFGYDVQKILTEKGYDGINGHTEFVVFDPEQVKSADLTTYDDKGNTILLSQRFNTANEDIRYSLSENKLDNGNNMVYNGKRGEVYVATDGFRNLQAECQGMSDEDIQLYHSGNKQIDEGLRERFSRSVKSVFLESENNGISNAKGLLNLKAKNNDFNMHEGVNGSLFHDVFEMARNHLKFGELVDLHGIETTEDGIGYDDCYNYLSDDGLSGFSITPDGDLISVFNASGKNGFLRAIAPIIKEKAKTLDCYASKDQNLMDMYSSIFGFKAASVMDYNMEYDHDNIAENHGMPQIAFMVNTERNVEKRQFTKDQYDAAVAYRNGFVMSENIAPAKHSLSNKGEQPSEIGTPAKDLYLAPTKEDISKMENTSNEAENTFEAPMQEEAAAENSIYDSPMQDNSMYDAPMPDESNIPPDVEYDYSPDTTALDEKALKNIGKKMRETLYLNAEETKAIQEVVQKYSTNEMPSREELFAEIKEKFGEKTWSEKNEDIAEVKRILRGYRFKVSDTIRGEVAYKYNTWTNFRKKYSGRLNFAKDGLDIDVAYMELSSEYPHLFPADIVNESDQFFQIANVADMSIREYNSMPLDDGTIQEAVNIITDEVRNYKENSARMAAEEYAKEALDSVAPPKAEQLINGTRGDALLVESLDNYPIKTVEDRVKEKIRAVEGELADNQQLRREATKQFDDEISRLAKEALSKKNPNTKIANTLLQRISNLEQKKASVDATYAKRISDLEAKIKTYNEELRSGEAVAEQRAMRGELHNRIVNDIKADFAKEGLDYDEVLKNAKDLSTFRTVDNTPQRVMEKALGYKAGQILADRTVNKIAQNETEGIKWLNSYLNGKDGVITNLLKKYGIKSMSKEDAAAQMYAEGFFVNENDEIVAYGDAELAQDFPNAKVRENIKAFAKDPTIRQIYDETLDLINDSRTRNAYPQIQKLDNYYLHFRAMGDTFSKIGLPFNPNDIKAKDLPTDLNGVTADNKPGQPFFASSMHRKGKRTSFGLAYGLEQYLTSAMPQIYHIDDIQTLRAIRNNMVENFGQANGLENLNNLSEEEAQERIKQVYNSHLSTFAKFLNEEANVVAGKTALIDRGIEGIFGRRALTTMNTINKQVGNNQVGLNVSSPLTNVVAAVQGIAKSNKLACVKSLAKMTTNKVNSIFGKSDGFAEKSATVIRRKGAEKIYRTPFQKVSDAGYVFMSATDNVVTEFLVRTKYEEYLHKGMSEEKALAEADKWASRLLGDRSLGQQPLIFNSKVLGILTKYQLEVRNQLDTQYYDTIQEAKESYENVENGLEKNAKIAAKVTKTVAELAVLQHLFGVGFEAVAGYNPAFDIISVIATALGFDDDDESEDTALDNIEQGFLELLGDLPYTSTFTGGRIPISSALPIEELITGKDSYGNEKSRWETLKETLPYYLLPTGYGQIKKSIQGNNLFNTDDEHPIAGSYTDSGDLRFPVEDNLLNRIQANLFGQWASENARDYIDNGRNPLNPEQTQEYIDAEMPIADYWKYRDGLKGLKTNAEKADYINSLDITNEQKNLLMNNILDREEDIDMSNYSNYDDWDEFDYAQKNPEKYEFFKKNNISYSDYKNADEDGKRAYTWAYENPNDYKVSKTVTNDVVKYRSYVSDLYDIRADKDKNGNGISGTAKAKKIDYINNLDLDYGAKIVLFKSLYPSDDTYNNDIIEYVNNRNDLSFADRVTIYKELGFTVKNGYVYWD
jgi:hypothetical protein